MNGSGAVTFRDLASARAAFRLGRVCFRCLVCGEVHRSDVESESRTCLRVLVEQCGWHGHPGFVPPPPAHTPAFLFVREMWDRFAAERQASIADAGQPDRAVLALGPDADVEAEVGAYLEELSEFARKRVGEMWEAWRKLTRWRRDLLSARPPAEIVIRAVYRCPDGFNQIIRYAVRPAAAVPPPFVGQLEINAVLLERSLQKMLPRPKQRLAPVLIGLTYRPDAFVAVFMSRLWGEGDETRRELFVYCEQYGQRGTCEPAALLPGESLDSAAERVLAEEGVCANWKVPAL